MTFIIDVRGGGPSSGYISAGFFGGKKLVSPEMNLTHDYLHFSFIGLTVGRVALLWVNKMVR